MPKRKPVPLDDYVEAQPLLRHIRVMRRVMEWVDQDRETRKFYPELHCAYMDILNKELAPYALTFALALTELEAAFPEIAALVERGAERTHVKDEHAPLPELKIATRVTPKDGERFAEAWVEASLSGSAMAEAFDATKLVVWPDLEDFMNPEYLRYHDISADIEKLVTEAVRPAIAEAFEKAAREVLARETCRE